MDTDSLRLGPDRLFTKLAPDARFKTSVFIRVHPWLFTFNRWI